MHWSTRIGRVLVWVGCVLGGTVALVAESPATPERPLRYLMVLKTPGPGASEPNVPEVGGRELSRWGTRRLIEIPRQSLDALKRRHDILYLALVDDGKETDAPRYVRPEESGAALTVETNAEPELTWDSGVYQYDGSGNITAIGGAAYRYDQAQRLVKAVMGGETIEYTYDSFGNQVQRKIGTTVIPSTASPRSNRLDYAEYDRAGNQTSAIGSGEEYVYDAANMIVQRKGIIPKRYIYTADDERIGTANGTEELEWEWTVRDFSGRVIATYEAVGKNELTTWEWQESHHYREGTLASGLKVEEHVRDPKGGRHFHVDHLGTPRLITNQARQQISAHDFHPFGREQTRLNQEFTDWGYRSLEPMKFTGHERDYTTSFDSNVHDYLDYMHARYYSPGWGRFLSVDPAMDLEKILPQPQLWNRYAYVGNNPLRYTDPDGRERLAHWHFNRQPVPDRGFKTEMIETAKTASLFAMALGIPMPGERFVGAVFGRISGFALGRLGFSAAERGVVGAATKILKAGGDDLIKAYESGQARELTIAGQKIVVQPDAPISGMTLHGENAFVLGKEAFASKEELAKTVLHEMYRLTFQSGGSASGASAAASTKAAAEFAEKAFDVIRFAF